MFTEEAAVAEDKGLAKSVTEQTLNEAADDARDDGKSSPDVETIYQQTREFIRLMEEMKMAPEKLQAFYEHLKLQNTSLQDSISSLRQKAEELKAIGPNFNRIESDLKSWLLLINVNRSMENVNS